MKVKIFIYICCCLCLVGCETDNENEPRHENVAGYVQKGPFISGTTINIQELDDNYNPSGKSYSLVTNDDFGSFYTQSQITSNYIELIATGYYFNEVWGCISEAPLTLRAISDLQEDKTSNINLLTTLAKNRIVFLIKNENKSFGTAKEQAEKELLSIFNIDIDAINFNELDISKDGAANGILLAISAILQGGNSVGELSEFIAKFIADFEPDGIIQSSDLIDKIKTNALNIDVNSIQANLSRRYSELQLPAQIPPFDLYVKRLCPLSVLSTTPANNDTGIDNRVSIEIFFNKSLKLESITNQNIKLTTNNNSVPIDFDFDPINYILRLKPTEELLLDKQYSVLLDKQVRAQDDDYLTDNYSFSFHTANIDIQSNLLAYYPFNGNLNDMSGNGKDALLVGGVFCTDKQGNTNSAVDFARAGDYLEMPELIDISSAHWTYSIWVQLEQYPKTATLLGIPKNPSATKNSDNSVPFYINYQYIAAYNAKDYFLCNPYIIALNKWYHLSLVLDKNEIKFFIDGKMVYKNSHFNTDHYPYVFQPYNGKLYVSDYDDPDINYYYEGSYLIGQIDNIRLYDRSLSEYEIRAIYEQD